MGFEPTATCLEGRSSTAELLPQWCIQSQHRVLALTVLAGLNYTVHFGSASMMIFDSLTKRDVAPSLTPGLGISKLIVAH